MPIEAGSVGPQLIPTPFLTCQFKTVDGQTCSNGLVGFEGTNDNGSACCPIGCGQCGGAGCGAVGRDEGLDNTDCCINGVLNNQELCSVTGTAPCVIDGGESFCTTNSGFEIGTKHGGESG